MSVTKSYTIWCEGTTYGGGETLPCYERDEDSFVSSIREMRETVAQTWTCVKGKDFCPMCSFARGYRRGELPRMGMSDYDVLKRIDPDVRAHLESYPNSFGRCLMALGAQTHGPFHWIKGAADLEIDELVFQRYVLGQMLPEDSAVLTRIASALHMEPKELRQILRRIDQ